MEFLVGKRPSSIGVRTVTVLPGLARPYGAGLGLYTVVHATTRAERTGATTSAH